MRIPVDVVDGIKWVGAIDWAIRDFHGYSTYKGTTYNSFLALDDKVALFDAVKKPFKMDQSKKIDIILRVCQNNSDLYSYRLTLQQVVL